MRPPPATQPGRLGDFAPLATPCQSPRTKPPTRFGRRTTSRASSDPRQAILQLLQLTLEALSDGGARHIHKVARREHVCHVQLLPRLKARRVLDLRSQLAVGSSAQTQEGGGGGGLLACGQQLSAPAAVRPYGLLHRQRARAVALRTTQR